MLDTKATTGSLSKAPEVTRVIYPFTVILKLFQAAKKQINILGPSPPVISILS